MTGALLLNSHTTYDWFYPYLRRDYSLFMLDDYDPPDNPVEQRTTALLDTIATGRTLPPEVPPLPDNVASFVAQVLEVARALDSAADSNDP